MKPIRRYAVRGDRVVHPDGTSSALISAGDVDIAALEPGRRSAAMAAFTRLCHTLDTPLQIVVRVRRLSADPCDAGGVGPHAALDRAMRRHWADRLGEGAVFTRAILLAVRAPEQAALQDSVGRACECLHAMGISACRLEGDALGAAVRAELPLDEPAAISARPHHVRAGATVIRAMALRRWPMHPVAAGWLAPLIMIPVECDIALHLMPAALSDALSKLSRRLRDFSAHRLLEAERGVVGDVHVDIALDSAMTLRGRLARNLGRPLHCSLTVAVRAASLDELRRGCDLARLAFAATLAGVEPAHFRHQRALLSALPLCVDGLSSTKLVESGAAATCVPWVDAPCADHDGYRIGAALRSGLPVRIAPFDTSLHANANIAIFAASGHGKSFAVGCLVLEAATHGADSVIIDPEGEYRGIVSALNGNYLALAPGTGASINIFDIAGGGDDEADEAISGVVALIAVLCGDRLGDVERAAVDAAARDALTRAAAQRRPPILSDCLPLLEARAIPVAAVVQRYCAGALGALFNRPTSVHLGGGVSAISMRDMPEEHVAAATLVVGRWLWQLVRHDRQRRHIVFDEVGALFAHPPLRALLVQLARRCRKYGASLLVATQNAQDLLSSDDGSVVATNCATALLGGHRPAETARMERAFGLTEAQRRFLETAARGEFLLIAGDRRLPIRIEVPGGHRAIINARQEAPTPLTGG